MKETAKSEQAGEHGESLEQVKQRFGHWRENHKRGEHISNVLWAAAVGVAKLHGIERTAQELRVNAGRLKKWVERSGGNPKLPSKTAPQFVEMFVPDALGPMPMCECIVEMENAKGAKMRIEFKSSDTVDLMGLSNAFWSSVA